MLADDDLRDVLVDQAVLAEEVIVEEMAERAVADVVEQAGDPHVLFHVVGGRTLFAQHLAERGVQAPGEGAGQVHGPQAVLEAAVLRRGIDPAGALKLEDVPEALEPGGIDQVLFRYLVGVPGDREGDVAVDRVGDE